ncbi:MAG: hypothetical protein R2695_07415 [Acidimicrobiales bacterium]
MYDPTSPEPESATIERGGSGSVDPELDAVERDLDAVEAALAAVDGDDLDEAELLADAMGDIGTSD